MPIWDEPQQVEQAQYQNQYPLRELLYNPNSTSHDDQ